MQNSPAPGTDEISRVLSLIQEGSRTQKCRISKGTLTFINPDVQALNESVSAFKKAPSSVLFEGIKQAVKQCEANGVGSYQYAQIQVLFRSLESSVSAQAKPSSSSNKI
jgi:hypothetical protein